MGLDMYLVKKTHVKNWEHFKPKDRHEVTVKRGGTIHEDIKPERIAIIEEDVAYWRKANQIHNWFVENVQDGKDDGDEYDVSKEQLQELVNVCKKVVAASKLVNGRIHNGYTFEKVGEGIIKKPILQNGKLIEDPAVAKELLPTTEGFFFGSTEYDQWYLDDVKSTITQIEPLLTEKADGHVYYRASW